MSTARKIVFAIYGLIFLGLLVFSFPVLMGERQLTRQKKRILALSAAEKECILGELIRVSQTTELRDRRDSVELTGRELGPPLSLLAPRRIVIRRDSAWLDLGYNFDHGVSLRAGKLPDGSWQLSAELEEHQPEKVLLKRMPEATASGR